MSNFYFLAPKLCWAWKSDVRLTFPHLDQYITATAFSDSFSQLYPENVQLTLCKCLVPIPSEIFLFLRNVFVCIHIQRKRTCIYLMTQSEIVSAGMNKQSHPSFLMQNFENPELRKINWKAKPLCTKLPAKDLDSRVSPFLPCTLSQAQVTNISKEYFSSVFTGVSGSIQYSKQFLPPNQERLKLSLCPYLLSWLTQAVNASQKMIMS